MASSYTEYFQLNQWAAEAEGKADRAQLTELSARVERAEQAAEENRTALEAAEQAWRDQNALHLLKTATLSTGGDNFQFSLIGVDWSLWRLVHLVIEPKVRDQQGVSLYLDGGKQLLSLVGYGSFPDYPLLAGFKLTMYGEEIKRGKEQPRSRRSGAV